MRNSRTAIQQPGRRSCVLATLAYGAASEHAGRPRRWLSLIVLATACSAFGGCDGKTKHPPNKISTGAGVTRIAENGPVSLALRVSSTSVDLTEQITVLVTVTADPTVTITEPDYGRALREGDRAFEYRTYNVEQQRAKPVGNGRLQWTYTYDLAFVLPGEYELPPLEIVFAVSSQDDTQPSPHEQRVATEPITIVANASKTSALSDNELRTITRLDPVELPWTWKKSYWFATAAVVVFLALAVFLLRRVRRRRRERAAIPIPADVWARRMLAALMADELLSKGGVQEFYYRISAIVRGYIERRYAVSAPEMTTEEFLATAVSDHRFGADTTAELNHFLIACDLVKYAQHQPGPVECDGVVHAARDFVEHTRERVVPKEPRPGGNGAPEAVQHAAEERAA